MVESKPILIRIAQKLITEETLEGEEVDALFNEHVDSPLPEATSTPAPVPAAAKTETLKPSRKVKKAPLIPLPLPKQAPATPD